MIDILQIKQATDFPAGMDQAQIVEFLHTHLDRFRDNPEAISKAIDYAFSIESGKGGYLLVALEDGKILGAVVMNYTGMEDFIPEEILVYIAVDEAARGMGIGTSLMKKVFENSSGNIALHVEYDNPAKKLYEKLGFSSKYAEMRWQKGS